MVTHQPGDTGMPWHWSEYRDTRIALRRKLNGDTR